MVEEWESGEVRIDAESATLQGSLPSADVCHIRVAVWGSGSERWREAMMITQKGTHHAANMGRRAGELFRIRRHEFDARHDDRFRP